MTSPVAELESNLQGMLNLKPPGITGSRINTLTTLCVENVQSESVLIQKLYTHFKKTPATHKLGVLYVVDSVTRKWMDQARQQGQPINSSAKDGTFGAAVNRVTELVPSLMSDIISTAPSDQKEKIRKLIEIWEKVQTFPTSLLESFKDKLSKSLQDLSTTPPGSPPKDVVGVHNTQQASSQAAAPQAVPANVLEALANIAKQSAASAAAPPQIGAGMASATPVAAPYSSSSSLVPPTNTSMSPAVNSQMSGAFPFLPASQPPGQNVGSQAPPLFSPPGHNNGQMPPPLPGQLGVNGQTPGNFAAAAPTAIPNAADPKMQSQILLIQALLAQGFPAEQITTIVQQLSKTNAAGPSPAAPGPSALYAPSAQDGYGNASGPLAQGWNASSSSSYLNDQRDGGYGGPRSPQRQRGRSRSRSPTGRWDSRNSHGPDDRYGQYGRRPSPNRGRNDDRERGYDRSDYRQRSPAGRRGASPQRDHAAGDGSQKWIEYDNSVPEGKIKVYSRTLFVGGVTCPEAELRGLFGKYGDVQTCIVNKDKRHAFVKMYTRADAVRAKEGMESSRNSDVHMHLRTRWGVGFGPRDCSDYQTGISVIPIDKLTDADRKWMLTAPFGGSGGKPITSKMAVEEPDIEIGAGVSSKAISRRMQTDRGGLHGPRSSRRDDDDDGQRGRFGRRGGREHNRRHDDRSGHGNGNGNGFGNNINNTQGSGDDQAAVADFPFGITMGSNGMPVFPPGFAFPAPNGQQHQGGGVKY